MCTHFSCSLSGLSSSKLKNGISGLSPLCPVTAYAIEDPEGSEGTLSSTSNTASSIRSSLCVWVCMFMYVCICVSFMYVCVFVCCMYVCMCVCIYISVSTYPVLPVEAVHAS